MKFEYYLNEALDDYVDMSVYYDEGKASWCMDMSRDLQTLTIGEPSYCYSPDQNSTYDAVQWVDIPKHIQDHFDKYRNKAKTILILGDSK